MCAAFVSVGLTASAGGPFTIGIRPIFLRLDPAAIAESRATVLAFDVDVTVGAMRMHFEWSAIPLTPAARTPTSRGL